MASPIFENYDEALEWLFSRLPMFSRVGAAAYKPGLQTTEALDELFDHPHRKFRSIHVAGTNGKGSTSHMIAAVLQAQGYKTALYTSPHLTDFRERIRINGEMIPEREVLGFINRWLSIKNANISPSFFELTMMMAFDWFAKEQVDYAVIEVGMGGRLDSTNVISPLLSVITNISFDHTQFLGDTLEKIAGEKAGIIKPGIPVVVGEASGNVKKVFEEKARDTGSPVDFADEDILIDKFERKSFGWRCSLKTNEVIDLPLAGEYQKKNLNTALHAINGLQSIGVMIKPESIREGLNNVDRLTGLRGRWQRVGSSPEVICDTGHNEAGLKFTMESLATYHRGRKVRFVVGFVNDKDVAHIVSLFPKDAVYYFTKAQIPRAMEEGKVAEYFSREGISGKTFPTVEEAFQTALKESSAEDLIFIGGSTFIVADFLKNHKETEG